MMSITVEMDGLGMVESPRWHDGKLWFADWTAGTVNRIERPGTAAVMVNAATAPLSFDWRPEGELLVLIGSQARVLRLHPDGSEAGCIDLSELSPHAWNDMTVDPSGNTYLGYLGFDFLADATYAPGGLAILRPDGSIAAVADALEFPNGVIVLPDRRVLVVAESYASRLTAFDIADDGSLHHRRVWADLDGAAPDGIWADASGAIWYADVGSQRCVRVAEGGQVLAVVDVDRGCFACAGTDSGDTIIIAAATVPDVYSDAGSGQILAVRLGDHTAHRQ